MPRTVNPLQTYKVRQHLRPRKYTYRQIANMCGVSDSYVREIEKRDRISREILHAPPQIPHNRL